MQWFDFQGFHKFIADQLFQSWDQVHNFLPLSKNVMVGDNELGQAAVLNLISIVLRLCDHEVGGCGLGAKTSAAVIVMLLWQYQQVRTFEFYHVLARRKMEQLQNISDRFLQQDEPKIRTLCPT